MKINLDKTRTMIFRMSCFMAAGMLAAGCGGRSTSPTAGPIALTDGLGREVSLKGPAERILSLAPSNTEILFAVGAGEQVVGRDTLSDYPELAKDLPDAGGGFGALNTEVIVSLEPDLVLAAEITPPEQVQALEQLGLTVFTVPNPVEYEDLFANLETIGRLTGREGEAQSLTAALAERVRKVEQAVSQAAERPLVFYELDSTEPNAPWTPGPGTFIETLIRTAGGENLGSELAGEWIQVSLEELIRRDPEVIILGDYTWGGVTPEMVKEREGWESIRAVKDGRIYTFDDNLVSRPGPRLVDGLEAMAKLLHPELFP